MNQKSSEILNLANLLQPRKPKFILEIGNQKGDSLYFFSISSHPSASLIGLDINEAPLLEPHFPSQTTTLFTLDSHETDSYNEVERFLDGNELDFLFIDGDHYGVEKDYLMYSPLVRKDGIIAFHDIVEGPPEDVGNVPEFWKELKKNKNYLEYIEDPSQGGWGIGVIFKE